MRDPRILLLLKKYLSEELTRGERTELVTMLEQLPNTEVAALLNEIETPDTYQPELSDDLLANRLDRIKDNLFATDGNNIVPEKSTKVKTLWPLIRRVAVAACLIVAGTAMYLKVVEEKDGMEIAKVLQDVSPAEPMAMITLENGDTIKVDSTAVGLIYSKNGMHVYKSENGEIVYKDSVGHEATPNFLTIHTPKGGFTKLKLDDGTIVQLNAASSIRYPSIFEKDRREVFVEGEAFFDVTPDKSRPFSVHSKKQIIQVLGTSFNLVSNENYARTTLLEGSVKIVSEGKDYFLKPGQQAMVSDRVVIKDVNPAGSVGWKNDIFVLDNSTFKETLKEVENWYDVQMVFNDTEIDHVQLSGTVSRNVKLSELLKVLEMNTNYKFEIEGRRVLVRRY